MITISDLRKALLPSQLDGEGDLSALRSRVIADFESRTGVRWNAGTDEEKVFEILPDRNVEPLRLHFMNISSLALSGWELSEEEADAEEIDDFYTIIVRRSGLIVKTKSWWPRFVKCSFDFGYSTLPAEFADVRDALLLQCRYIVARHTSDKLVVSGQGMEGGSATYYMDADLHPVYKAVIERYQFKC